MLLVFEYVTVLLDFVFCFQELGLGEGEAKGARVEVDDADVVSSSR